MAENAEYAVVVFDRDGSVTAYGPMAAATAERLACRLEAHNDFEIETRTLRLNPVRDLREAAQNEAQR